MDMDFFYFLNNYFLLRHLQSEGRLAGVSGYSVPQVPGTVMMIQMTALMPLCKSFWLVNWATGTVIREGCFLVSSVLHLYLSVCCLFAYVSVCLSASVCLSVCLFVYMIIYSLYIDLSLWNFTPFIYIFLRESWSASLWKAVERGRGGRVRRKRYEVEDRW